MLLASLEMGNGNDAEKYINRREELMKLPGNEKHKNQGFFLALLYTFMVDLRRSFKSTPVEDFNKFQRRWDR